MVASPLHVHRNRGRPVVPVVLPHTVAATPRAAVPGTRQRRSRSDGLRARSLRGVAGALHGVQGHQPTCATMGVDHAAGDRRHRPDPDDRLLPRLAGRSARSQWRTAAGVLGPPTDRRPVDRLPVLICRNRAADRQIGALPGATAQSLCSAADFGCRRGGALARLDDCAAQRRRGAVRDGHHQQDLLRGERRNRSRIPGAEVEAPVRRPGVARQLGVARPPGSGLRVGGPDGRGAHQVQRQARDRSDPCLCRPAFGRRHQGNRRTGRRGITSRRRT